ncbi:MAG: helix-turn-helix transcriptional regulator [Chloroflexota bacterium]|nr:helix-turn-helix transcriptional regulator [Chloroflexota bacterium]MYE38713.1 helix-turn-helix transcriptional regulator [Chloroflexota bacterium]
MPGKRFSYGRRVNAFPKDFRERLKRFKAESGLSWAEISRRLGIHPETVRRWKEGHARPNAEHMLALCRLADDLGLGRLFRV